MCRTDKPLGYSPMDGLLSDINLRYSPCFGAILPVPDCPELQCNPHRSSKNVQKRAEKG